MPLGIYTSRFKRVFPAQQTLIDGVPVLVSVGSIYYVDGSTVDGVTHFGSDFNSGLTPQSSFATIQKAFNTVSPFDTVCIFPKKMAKTDTDPGSYSESAILSTPQVEVVGVPSGGRTQGGLPQLKVGTTTTLPVLTVKAPGCTIANLGINGNGGTGGGIKLDDDGGTSKTAFGTTIVNCHIKNCVGTSASDGTLGGGIMLVGAPWQVRILGNRFLLNLSDVIAIPTFDDAKDIVIEDNIFGGPAASVDFNIWMIGSGADATGLIIRNNVFQALGTKNAGSRFVKLTGYTGIMAGNYFGANNVDFKATTGSGGIVPTTVLMAGNHQEITGVNATVFGRTT